MLPSSEDMLKSRLLMLLSTLTSTKLCLVNSALILKTIPVSPCSPTRPVFFIHPWVDVGGSKPTSYMDRDLIWWAGLQRRPWGEVLIEVLEKRRIDRTERVRCDFTFSTTACCLLTWVWCCKWSNRNTNFCVCMKKSHEKVCKKKKIKRKRESKQREGSVAFVLANFVLIKL